MMPLIVFVFRKFYICRLFRENLSGYTIYILFLNPLSCCAKCGWNRSLIPLFNWRKYCGKIKCRVKSVSFYKSIEHRPTFSLIQERGWVTEMHFHRNLNDKTEVTRGCTWKSLHNVEVEHHFHEILEWSKSNIRGYWKTNCLS